MLRRRCSFVIRCTLLLLFACPFGGAFPCPADGRVAGQEWTRFRGPNGSGQSDDAGIPTSWIPEDYNWRVKLPGIGHSSPVIWGDRVFVTCTLEEDATQIICCLDTSDGGLIWDRRFESTPYKKNPSNSYAAATPTIDQDHVYMSWATPREYTLVALEQNKGQEVWRRDLGPYLAQHGFGASPVLVEDLVIVPNEQLGNSSVVAVDRMTGETRWKTELPVKIGGYSTPCIFRPDGGPPQLILSGSEYGLTSLDPRAGRKNWEIEVFPARVVGSPVVAGGLIFGNCGQGGGGKRMVAVRPGTPANGNKPELVYDYTKAMPYVPTPVAHGDLLFLFADSGIVTCLDAPSGEIHWQQRIGGSYFGSPVRVGDRIYCISREGEMVVLAAAEKYRLLAKINLEEPSNSTPAVARGVMYVRTASHLMAVGAKSP